MASSAAPLDGRTARSVRSRAGVVDALLSLLEEGDLQPTAARVAERAGVSLRLIFQHFEDLELLYAEAADRQMARRRALLSTPVADGPLARRLAQFVARRADALEIIAPVRRAALLRAPFSAVLSKRLQHARREERRQLQAVFAPELAAIAPTGRAEVLAGLAVATGFATWESLRREQNLSAPRAQQVMRRLVRALLSSGG